MWEIVTVFEEVILTIAFFWFRLMLGSWLSMATIESEVSSAG